MTTSTMDPVMGLWESAQLRLISAQATAMRSPVDKRQNSASAPFTCGVLVQ